ncbi:glycosyltransferase family 4 protein [Nocardioides glacieisoli]|nr:glycosyltransferase family 4 protein [Nocardioides glacieisoli]
MNDDVRRPRALVLSGHDLGAWRAEYARGAAPAALPYEVDALGRAGLDITVRSNIDSAIVDRLRRKIEHRTEYSVALPLRGMVAAGSADVVVALLEREGALPAILKQRRVPPYARRPLVIWSCWLADDLQCATPQRREELSRIYRGADLITHLSRHEASVFADAGFREDQLFPITYGVSHRYYVPGDDSERDIDLLAVGQDRGRDYATLFDAIAGTTLRLQLVCRPENLAGLRVPDNVTVVGTVPREEYRALLRRSKVVAIPTRVLTYPTGSSVALEASSSGCCVVATDTPAMADYVQHERTGLLVAPGDSAGWGEALVRLRDDEALRARLGSAARTSVEMTFNAEHMWSELADEMRRRELV